ncbi:MAG TPA: hypothetical protein VGQ71_06120 [Terriglobales bacterium]|jgi:hypothetical protein|nr:hypothetical protein [Terriglobales bacterium]
MHSTGSNAASLAGALDLPSSIKEYGQCKRRLAKARAEFKHASDRLFQMCCELQRVPESLDPEELSLALRHYWEAEHQAEVLETIVATVEVRNRW